MAIHGMDVPTSGASGSSKAPAASLPAAACNGRRAQDLQRLAVGVTEMAQLCLGKMGREMAGDMTLVCCQGGGVRHLKK